MTIDCDGSVGLTQMAGSSALSPLVATGTVSPSALTRMGAALAGDWKPPATSSVHSTPTPNFENSRRLITSAPLVINPGGASLLSRSVLRPGPTGLGRI